MEASEGGSLFTLSIDRDWRITSISPSAASWGGSTPPELVGADSRERWPLPQPLVEAINGSLSTGETATAEFPSVLIPGRWVRFHVAPSKTGADISFEDVTQSIVARQRLAGANAADPYGLVGGTAEIALLDASCVIVSVNAAWRASAASFSPRLPAAGVGMSYLDLCTRLLPQLNPSSLAADLEELFAGATPLFRAMYDFPTPAYAQIRQVQITRLLIGNSAYFVAIHEDLTPRREIAHALRETSKQLLHAQEDERRRIAQELHDSMSQNLVAMSFGLVRLRGMTKGVAQAGELIGELSNLVQEAMSEMRGLSFVMTASRLQHLGLAESVRSFVEGFGRRTGLCTEFSAEGPADEADDETQHAIFRVVQEAVTNALRHSGATEVRVAIEASRGELTARIGDNGGGMPFSPADWERAPLGVGIAGMRARMEQLGGKLEITSDRAGTTITARVPTGRSAARAGADEAAPRSQSVTDRRRHVSADISGRAATENP